MVLPIKQEDIYMGSAEISGLLRLEKDFLEIEYQVKDVVLGMFDSEFKTCRISLEKIDSIEIEEKWFSGRFNIYLNRLPDLDTAFNLDENCLSFKFKKKKLEIARSLKSKLMLELSERKLKNLEDEGEHEIHSPGKKDPEIIEIQEENQAPKQKRPEKREGLKNMLREDDKK